jgi:hypothetical protein
MLLKRRRKKKLEDYIKQMKDSDSSYIQVLGVAGNEQKHWLYTYIDWCPNSQDNIGQGLRERIDWETVVQDITTRFPNSSYVAHKGYWFDVGRVPNHELHVLLSDEEAVTACHKWYLALPDDIDYGNFEDEDEEWGWSEDEDEDDGEVAGEDGSGSEASTQNSQEEQALYEEVAALRKFLVERFADRTQ